MSKVIKCQNYEWDVVERKSYKSDSTCYKGVDRFALLGEWEDEQQLNFHTRYFEVEAWGYTTLEYHRHPHSVIIIRGSGTLILGNHLHKVDLHDVLYITPDTLHQFHADREEPLGFICIVDRYRDKLVLPDEKYLEENINNEEVWKKLKRWFQKKVEL